MKKTKNFKNNVLHLNLYKFRILEKDMVINKYGMLIWITGLAGAGKTTLANKVYNDLKKRYPNIIHLDGDEIREALEEHKSHDLESRKRTAQIYANLARLFTSKGINVVVSTISLFHNIHEYNRTNNKRYFEIFLDADREKLEKRKEELYSKKDKDGIVGIEHIPEIPKNPDLILKNNYEEDVDENVKKIIDLIEKQENEKKNSLWDYNEQAKFYYKRPNYSKEAIEYMCNYVGAKKEKSYVIADIGAGTGNLTVLLKDKSGKIIAIEPTKAMMDIGIDRTKDYLNIQWIMGTGEKTNLPDNSIDFVTFGSSFNTTDREQTLKECFRILKPNGFFACMWNNRDLTIPTQKKVEDIIKKYYPDYFHGTRREQQADIILSGRLFNNIHYIEFPQEIKTNIEDYCEAWCSVKNNFWDLSTEDGRKNFEKIINDIKEEFKETKELNLIYVTKIWIAQKQEPKIKNI